MLCAVCLLMFQTPDEKGLHHLDHQSLFTAAANGCKICRAVCTQYPSEHSLSPSSWTYEFQWDAAWEFKRELTIHQTVESSDRWPSVAYVHVAKTSGFPAGYKAFLELATDDVKTDPRRVRVDFPPMRDIPDSTGDPRTLDLARKWLQTCKDEHDCEKKCGPRQKHFMPQRLIHVGGSSQPARLVLRDSDHPDGPYATLSHCWGTNPNFMTLNTQNLNELRREIQLDKLAASFREAIVTCRQLNIPYLWIDTLCILQSGDGHQSDWLGHSTEMSQIYLNCELNIAIEASADPHEGAFRSRDTRYLQNCYVWTAHCNLPEDWPSPFQVDLNKNSFDASFGCQEGQQHPAEEAGSQLNPDVERKSEKSSSQDSDDVYLLSIYTESDFTYERRSLPLSKRAWVYQESLMSPRTLHFMEDRISWQCGAKWSLSEYMHDSLENRLGDGFDCLYKTPYNIGGLRGPNFDDYHEYVHEYTDRLLSHPDTDKLVAFAAIAERFSEWFGNEYCAGIFRTTMPWALLWRTAILSNGKRPTTYRAPSWSWASVDLPVHYFPYDAGGERIDSSRVESVDVELVDPSNRFGQIKSASLRLTGPIVSAQKLVVKDVERQDSDSDYDSTRTVVTRKGFGVTLLLDEVRIESGEDPADDGLYDWLLEQENATFVVIGSLNGPTEKYFFKGTYGLLVDRLDDGTYTRLAMWKADLDFLKRHEGGASDFSVETITIV